VRHQSSRRRRIVVRDVDRVGRPRLHGGNSDGFRRDRQWRAQPSTGQSDAAQSDAARLGVRRVSLDDRRTSLITTDDFGARRGWAAHGNHRAVSGNRINSDLNIFNRLLINNFGEHQCGERL
jgi:hypothetical protein